VRIPLNELAFDGFCFTEMAAWKYDAVWRSKRNIIELARSCPLEAIENIELQTKFEMHPRRQPRASALQSHPALAGLQDALNSQDNTKKSQKGVPPKTATTERQDQL
jgi:hypothetical protein